MDDAVIIDLFWSRSEIAINETAIKYGKYCNTIAMNILQCSEDAKEIVNDTYLKTWNSLPPQRPTIFSAFIGKITRNLSINKYKEKKAKKRGGSEITLVLEELSECIPSTCSVEASYESKIIANIISQFLFSISQDDRVIFVRRYWYVDSIIFIANRLKVSESKVKSSLYRTRNKLRLYLDKEGVVI